MNLPSRFFLQRVWLIPSGLRVGLHACLRAAWLLNSFWRMCAEMAPLATAMMKTFLRYVVCTRTSNCRGKCLMHFDCGCNRLYEQTRQWAQTRCISEHKSGHVQSESSCSRRTSCRTVTHSSSLSRPTMHDGPPSTLVVSVRNVTKCHTGRPTTEVSSHKFFNSPDSACRAEPSKMYSYW